MPDGTAQSDREREGVKPEGGKPSPTLQGQKIAFEDPEPWPEQVATAGLLEDLERLFGRYLVLPPGAEVALPLWVLHTWTHDVARNSPLLSISSDTKRCGKTTLLEVLARVVQRPLLCANVTPAVLFRSIEKHRPTLLLDEAETYIHDREELRGILNSSHTRDTAYVIRCVGDHYEPRRFSTWTPIAFGSIHKLPDTIQDRSIPILMRRKKPTERAAKLRTRALLGETGDLRRQLARWRRDHLPDLEDADPPIPERLDDRAADSWAPLLAIADLAGPEWGEKARSAAVLLSVPNADPLEAYSARFLKAIRQVFADAQVDRLPSRDLCSRLSESPAAPWSWPRFRPLKPQRLALLLRPYGLRSKTVRLSGDRTAKGYLLEDIDRAIAEHLAAPPQGTEQAVTPSQLGEAIPEGPAPAPVDAIRPGSVDSRVSIPVADKDSGTRV